MENIDGSVSDPKYEVCIVGCGASGGVLAYQCALAGLNTVVIDSGDLLDDSYFTNLLMQVKPASSKNSPFDRKSEKLLQVDVDPEFNHYSINKVNGLQNLWGGVSLRFSEADFVEGDWPITYSELAPFYDEIEELIGVTGNCDGLSDLPDGKFIQPFPYSSLDKHIVGKIRSKCPLITTIANRKAVETRPNRKNTCLQCGMCQNGCSTGSVYKFTSRLLPQISKLSNFVLMPNTLVQKLLVDSNGDISGVLCSGNGSKLEKIITSKIFVISSGALNTPKLLLESRSLAYPHGISNNNRSVGKGLMDNPNVVIAAIFPSMFFRKIDRESGYGNHILIPDIGGDGVKQLVDVYHGNSKLFPMFRASMPWFIPDFLLHFIIRRVAICLIFSPADPENKNSIAMKNDGTFLIKHSFSEREVSQLASMDRRARQLFSKIGGFVLGSYPGRPGDSIHYAGTCRMGKDSTQSVVDINLQSHEHRNLFICDGSVFPSLPEKHPTLTIMALAARLSLHIHSKLRSC